jgi:vacuolar-type H+-ATPase subunit H
MIDIDKAIAENEQRIDEAMARHRELIAQIDKETAELNQRIDAVLAEHGETLREIFTEKK